MKLPPPFVEGSDQVHVVVECPKGSHNKFTYEPDFGLFKLSTIFPAGVTFPFEFGFVPGTKADDGDPFDVFLLTDDTLFPGCLAEARLIGIIEAEQNDEGRLVRNDRAIAVSVESHRYRDLKSIGDLHKSILDDMVDFITAYQKRTDHHFTPLQFAGPERALELIRKSVG